VFGFGLKVVSKGLKDEEDAVQDQTYLRAQLKEFREDDEARWRYEAQEIERQTRILRETGRSDRYAQDEMKRAGIAVDVLLKESEEEAKRLKQAHDELRKIEPPPGRRGQKERVVMEDVAARAHSHTWLFPPAYEGWGNTEQCGFNLGLGEFNVESHQTGDGWGLEARAYLTQYCTMWFYYFPPRSGELLVQPHVDFQGDVALSAHDHWYTSTHAHVDCNFRTGADRRIRVEHIWVNLA
jgi:hypothetical protein